MTAVVAACAPAERLRGAMPWPGLVRIGSFSSPVISMLHRIPATGDFFFRESWESA